MQAMEQTRQLEILRLGILIEELSERERHLKYLAEKVCPGNRAEAELELARVRDELASANSLIKSLE